MTWVAEDNVELLSKRVCKRIRIQDGETGKPGEGKSTSLRVNVDHGNVTTAFPERAGIETCPTSPIQNFPRRRGSHNRPDVLEYSPHVANYFRPLRFELILARRPNIKPS